MKRYLIGGSILVLSLALIAGPMLALAAERTASNDPMLAYPPPKPPKPPPKPYKPPPKPGWYHHHHHYHHHRLPPPVAGVPWQGVRYVRVSNQTGLPLTVYARIGDSSVWSWYFAPGATGYLFADGDRLATSEVYLWATSGGRMWPAFRDQPLVVVPTPYLSRYIDSYTYTFYP